MTLNPGSNFTKSLLAFTLIVFLINGCKKKDDETTVNEAQPLASFTSSKSEYTAGEIIKLTSTSSNASRFRWTLPNGETATSAAAEFMTEGSLSTGTLPFKLEVYSENSTKSDFCVKNIKVTAAGGKVVFYSTYTPYFGKTLDVYSDNVLIGSIVLPSSSSTPDCTSNPSATISITAGTHYIQLKQGSSFYGSGNVTVNKNGCTVFPI